MGVNPTPHSMLLAGGSHQQALVVALPHWVTRELYQSLQKEASTIKGVESNAEALGLFLVSSQAFNFHSRSLSEVAGFGNPPYRSKECLYFQ